MVASSFSCSPAARYSRARSRTRRLYLSSRCSCWLSSTSPKRNSSSASSASRSSSFSRSRLARYSRRDFFRSSGTWVSTGRSRPRPVEWQPRPLPTSTPGRDKNLKMSLPFLCEHLRAASTRPGGRSGPADRHRQYKGIRAAMWMSASLLPYFLPEGGKRGSKGLTPALGSGFHPTAETTDTLQAPQATGTQRR